MEFTKNSLTHLSENQLKEVNLLINRELKKRKEKEQEVIFHNKDIWIVKVNQNVLRMWTSTNINEERITKNFFNKYGKFKEIPLETVYPRLHPFICTIEYENENNLKTVCEIIKNNNEWYLV